MRRALGLISFLLALVAGPAWALGPPCALSPGETRAIARVIDGDTLALDDGRTLRLIGTLAPHADDVGAQAGSWPPENAARAGLTSLIQGQSVRLWHDQVRHDRYGRILAHVMRAQSWLQGELVERGWARAYARPGMDACTPELVRRERMARAAQRGLWANAAYGIRSAARHDWSRESGSFQIVSGRVRRVSRGNDVYVTLGPRRRTSYAFAAVVPRGRTELMAGLTPRALIGRRILVRGWIEQRRGPVIVIDSRGQIELLDELN